MKAEYLPEFEGAYLEDSYFLGLVADGANLRLRGLFALTTEHHAYAPPLSGEQHSYREGSFLLERPNVVDWRPGKPAITRDPDGTFDLGSIELYRSSSTRVRFVTEWFDAVLEAEVIRLELF